MLCKRNQTKKATYSIILFIWHCKGRTLRSKWRSVDTRGWVGGRIDKGYEETFWHDGLGWLYGHAFAKIHRMYLKRVNCTACKLYLNRFDFTKKLNNNDKPVIYTLISQLLNVFCVRIIINKNLKFFLFMWVISTTIFILLEINSKKN